MTEPINASAASTEPTTQPPTQPPTGTLAGGALASGASGKSRVAKWLRPSTILPGLAIVLVLAILLTPTSPDNTDLRLTTYSTGPAGAKGLYEVAGRLGWRTARRETPFTGVLDSNAVYAVFGGSEPMTAAESRALLDAVRRGAGLLYLLDSGPLTDSLPLRRADTAGRLAPIPAADTAGCPNELSLPVTLVWLGSGVELTPMSDAVTITDDSVHATVSLPADTTVFLSVNVSRRFGKSRKPAIVGLPLGRGRLVMVSDPDLLRNDVVRVCRFAIGTRVIAALAYASGGRRVPLVFDEFHQGYGVHPSPTGAATRFLLRHPAGHAVDQLLIGGLVLILAFGIRAIAPRTVPTIERRSPLEHVDALARAYAQVRATRTVTARLIKGLRRRHDHGGWSARAVQDPDGMGSPDERFLAAIAETHPRLAPAVKLLLSSGQAPVAPAELLQLSAAVDQIDRAFPS